MSKTITCTLPDIPRAEEAVDRLRGSGFSNNEISILFARSEPRGIVVEEKSKAPEGAAAGAGTGGVIGGILGWLAGIGSLAIPGLGPFIAAGPIMAALSGGAVGAAVGGLIGSLVGLGIPEMEAKQFEKRLKEGQVLISIHADSVDEVKTAKEILKECGACDISESADLAA